MSRKYEAIDLMKLRAQGSTNGWNEILTKYYNRRDINALAKLKYQICAGMDDLAKQKINNDEINAWWCRLVKSIETTAKRIIKLQIPMPGDNPLMAAKLGLTELEAKRRRDRELAKFMKESSY